MVPCSASKQYSCSVTGPDKKAEILIRHTSDGLSIPPTSSACEREGFLGKKHTASVLPRQHTGGEPPADDRPGDSQSTGALVRGRSDVKEKAKDEGGRNGGKKEEKKGVGGREKKRVRWMRERTIWGERE